MEKLQFRVVVMIDAEIDDIEGEDKAKEDLEKAIRYEIRPCELVAENGKGQIEHVSLKNINISISRYIEVK